MRSLYYHQPAACLLAIEYSHSSHMQNIPNSQPQKSHPNYDTKFDVQDLLICISSTRDYLDGETFD